MLPDAPARLNQNYPVSLMPSHPSLQGLRLLVVEDETIIAMLVEDMLTDLGCVVVGVAGTVADGLAVVSSGRVALDGAVLDVNIGGEKVFPVADALAARGVPFVFATGYGTSGVLDQYANTRVIAKPFQSHTLENALAATFEQTTRSGFRRDEMS